MSGPAPLPDLCALCRGWPRVGVAVSGGGDSVAALMLAVEALGAARVSAVTVDHALRAGSADEAAQVAELCEGLGVAHEVLRWHGSRGGNLQDAARRARHDLIGGWAQGRVDVVVLGHTLDDQAETVLMRLARGSGVDGLSGMVAQQRIGGVTWLRPFLETRRRALRDVLEARGIGWVEDPSNEDTRFQRVRARQALAALDDLGLDAEGLARTAQRMRRARQALEAQTQTAIRDHLCEMAGIVRLDAAARDLVPEIRDRLFSILLRSLSGAEYPPRLDALQRLTAARRGALMGCAILEADDNGLLVFREAAAVSALEAPHGERWDRRWRAEGPGGAGVVIRAMGDEGLVQLSVQAARGLHPHWRETGLPRAALAGLPALWSGDEMIAAPLAFWPQGWQLNARPLAAMMCDTAESH